MTEEKRKMRLGEVKIAGFCMSVTAAILFVTIITESEGFLLTAIYYFGFFTSVSAAYSFCRLEEVSN